MDESVLTTAWAARACRMGGMVSHDPLSRLRFGAELPTRPGVIHIQVTIIATAVLQKKRDI